MAKVDWNITGTGGYAVIFDGVSKRLKLDRQKQLLWNGRNDLANCELTVEIKENSNLSTHARGGIMLRSDPTGLNCYKFQIYGNRVSEIIRVVSGVSSLLSITYSTQPYDQYLKTKFSVDGWRLLVHEWYGGQWNLLQGTDDTLHSHAQGYIGLCSNTQNINYWVLFDNVEIGEK